MTERQDLSERPEPGAGGTDYKRAVTDLLEAYRLPVSVVMLAAAWWLATGGDPAAMVTETVAVVPAEFWTLSRYLAVGAVPGLILSWWMYARFVGPQGLRAMVVDPETDRYRDVRIPEPLWQEADVVDPHGETEDRENVRSVTINGERGVELLDYRELENGGLETQATWMGGASAAEIRGWKQSVDVVKRRLSQQADAALGLRANIRLIARDSARDVLQWMIETQEAETVPQGERIAEVIEANLSKYGAHGTVSDMESQEDETPSYRDEPERDGSQAAKNGHSQQTGANAGQNGGQP